MSLDQLNQLSYDRLKLILHSSRVSNRVNKRVGELLVPDLSEPTIHQDKRYEIGGEFMTELVKNINKLLGENGVCLYLHEPNNQEDNFYNNFYQTLKRETQSTQFSNIKNGDISTDSIDPDTKITQFGKYGTIEFLQPSGNLGITPMDTLRNLRKALKELQKFEKMVNYQILGNKMTAEFIDEFEIAQENSITDKLTGLPNRRGAEIDQDLLINEYKEGKTESGVVAIMVDLDKFKAVNDTGNHALGDQVLRGFAKCIQDYFHSIGYSERFKVARLGGEEFQILVTGVTSETEMRVVVEGLMNTIRNQKYFISDKMYDKLNTADKAYKALDKKLRTAISGAFAYANSQHGLTKRQRDKLYRDLANDIINDTRKKGFVEPIKRELIDQLADGSLVTNGGKHFIRSTASVGGVYIDGKKLRSYIDQGKNPFPGIIKLADTKSYESKQGGRDRATLVVAKSIPGTRKSVKRRIRDTQPS